MRIEDVKAGLSVRRGDAKGLAEAMARNLIDESLAETMAEKGWRTLDKVTALTVYEEWKEYVEAL